MLSMVLTIQLALFAKILIYSQIYYYILHVLLDLLIYIFLV